MRMNTTRCLFIKLFAVIMTIACFAFVSCSDSNSELKFEIYEFTEYYNLVDSSVGDGVLLCTGRITWPISGLKKSVKNEIREWIKDQLLTIQPQGYYTEDGEYKVEPHPSIKIEGYKSCSTPKEMFNARTQYIFDQTNRDKDGITAVEIIIDYNKYGSSLQYNFMCKELHYDEYYTVRQSSTQIYLSEMTQANKTQ